MLGDILSALGAAGEGGMDVYTWQKQYEQQDRSIDARKEIARLNGEIRMLVNGQNEGGRMARHETPSGSVVAQQAGANSRAAAGNETRTAIAEMNADVQRNNESGRNTRFEKGISARDIWTRLQDATRNRGITVNDENADDRDETTRRGQDMGLGSSILRDVTTRRGQDLGAETTRRGQDIRGAGATGAGLPSPDEPALEPDAAPSATPTPDRAALASQLSAAITAVRNAKTPEAQRAARQALAALRAQVK